PDPETGRRYWADLHMEGDPVYTRRTASELAMVSDAVGFLSRAPQDRPWCQVVSFHGPHYPQVCTQALYDSYDGVALPAMASADGVHPRHQHWRRCWGFDRLTEEQNRRGRVAYLAMITQVDLWLQEVLDALEA